MTDEPEVAFSALDAPTARGRASYALPLPEWNEMVALANHLAKREAEMPLRRRMESFLKASNQAYSAKDDDHADGLSYGDEDQRED